MAVAEASFSTVNDSTSSMLISFIFRSNPSINTNAPEPAPKVEIPRIQNSDILLPGCPDVWRAIIPATLPANAFVMLDVEVLSVLTSTVVAAPVIVIFFCAPVPVITTSSIAVALASCITILMIFWSLTSISCFSNPIKVNTSFW